MICTVSGSQQLTRACGGCHSRTSLRPIAPRAAPSYGAVRSAHNAAGSSVMQRAVPSSKSLADSKQQQDAHATIKASTSQSAQQWPVFKNLLERHTSLLAFAVLMLYLVPTEPAAADSLHQHPASLFDLAEGEEGIVSNMVKYARYFVTVLLGTGYVMVQPLVAAFKKPVTAVVAIVGVVGGAYLLKITLDAMLGIQEPFTYEAGSIVPYS